MIKQSKEKQILFTDLLVFLKLFLPTDLLHMKMLTTFSKHIHSINDFPFTMIQYYSRYEAQSRIVEVPHNWAASENFTLKVDNSSTWSQQEDFGVTENLKEKYLSNSEINVAMAKIENQHPDIAEFLANDNEWSMKLHALQMGTEVSILLILLKGSFQVSCALGSPLFIWW